MAGVLISGVVIGIQLANLNLAVAAEGPGRYLKQDGAWFHSAEALKIADTILTHQSDLGGWPKNADTTSAPYSGDRKKLQPTFDNGATTDEIRLLARVYNATKQERFRDAAVKGFDYVLKGQYPNGGWPQYYPPPAKSYHRHITFNDNAMVRLLEFLRETTREDRYAFLGDERRAAAGKAFERGIECILRCQVKVDGTLTVWCVQHDEKTLEPRPARAYELVSLSGAESVGIVRLLMSLEQPTPEIKRSITSAIAWFEKSKLTGIRVVETKTDGKKDRVVEQDATAPALWARFYEIGTNRPFFCDRDGVKKYSLAEIGHERRNGYAWYGSWPAKLLESEYPRWAKAQNPGTKP